MIIMPKDEATLNFLLGMKKLKDGWKVSISPLSPKERRTKWCYLGSHLKAYLRPDLLMPKIRQPLSPHP